MNRFTAAAAIAGLASPAACSNGPTDAAVVEAPGAPLLAAGNDSGRARTAPGTP